MQRGFLFSSNFRALLLTAFLCSSMGPAGVAEASPTSRPHSKPTARTLPTQGQRRAVSTQPQRRVVPQQNVRRLRALQRKRRKPAVKKETLWHTVKTFWGPKVKFVWKANKEFWGPRLRARAKEGKEFWGPKVKFVWKANKEYWIPKLSYLKEANREFWGPLINKQYLPYVRNQYRFLKYNYGTRISKMYARGVRRLKPILRDFPVFLFKESYRKVPNRWKKSLERVPAPVKKSFDHYFSWSLKNLPTTQQINGRLPKHLQHTMKQLSQAMHVSRRKKFNRRVKRVFAKVRRFALDQGMVPCYRVVALDSPVMNAFNTGCTTYVTSGLAGDLTDLELAAVFAHELAHGDHGHAVRNLWLLSKSVGEHLYQLMSEEVEWFLTGRTGPALRRVMRQGNLLPLLEAFGKKAPKVELEADKGGTLILLRAGISPKHLVHALLKLHGKQPGEILKKNTKDIQALRNYPSLYRRVQMVRRVWGRWKMQNPRRKLK
ncbi:MAG: hypothetical protein EP343_31925 [Deltaproteobacteria bacterium]|nr:MAG: hypothetical protein EP343_31925 [Deltaproteobacteria bacterium]